MSLAALLLEPPEGATPSEVVIHAGESTVTRGALTEQALRLRAALVDAGVGGGAPVAVMLGNTPFAVAALFGVWAAGAVHVPLNPRLADDEIERLLDAVAPAAAVTTADHADRFTDLPTVVIDDGTRVQRRAARAARSVGLGYDADVALVQLTSGTTGRAKPVLLTHSGVLSLMDGVLRTVRGKDSTTKRSSTPNVIPVSLSTWAGIYNVCFAFRVGAPVVLMERFEPRAFAELVDRHGIKSVVLPPAAMAMLSDDDTITSLGSLQWVRSISAPLSPFQAKRFHDKFDVGILNSYGQTELGGEVIGWSAADWRTWGATKLGAVGRPHDGVDVQVIDGEICVRALARAAGYADDTAMSDRITADGWFRTGDVGHVDADGFVWVEGRVSDQINRGGMKIVPAEVEEVLRAAPGIREAVVVGVPDDRLGEVPVAFVVGPTDAVDPSALEAHCRAHLSPWKIPTRFTAVATLPRNEAGKVLTRELQL